MAPAWSRDSPSALNYEALKTEKKSILLLYLDLVLLCNIQHALHIMCMTLALWLCCDAISVNLHSISAMNIMTGFMHNKTLNKLICKMC